MKTKLQIWTELQKAYDARNGVEARKQEQEQYELVIEKPKEPEPVKPIPAPVPIAPIKPAVEPVKPKKK